MGVRFECPNGHKLHVKAELAGKRGICPQCQARFVVPAFSGQRVEAVVAAGAPAEAPGVVANTSQTAREPAAPKTASFSASTADTPPVLAIAVPLDEPQQPDEQLASAAPVAWYLRPADGGQYGPATEEMFQRWIDEGRVSPDSWVWRTGWAEWKAGSEVLPAQPLPPFSPPWTTPVAVQNSTAAPAAPRSMGEVSRAEARRAEITRRKRRMQAVSIALGLLALGMLIVLILVLSGR
ncbi:MAG: hypothetical protein DCC67_06015 [Planctomycetota bacterium]|nr:MAG: hypothetical protein DCC67_06015 [Planctomycetota bacterium]